MPHSRWPYNPTAWVVWKVFKRWLSWGDERAYPGCRLLFLLLLVIESNWTRREKIRKREEEKKDEKKQEKKTKEKRLSMWTWSVTWGRRISKRMRVRSNVDEMVMKSGQTMHHIENFLHSSEIYKRPLPNGRYVSDRILR
jgi:hypothetical protein